MLLMVYKGSSLVTYLRNYPDMVKRFVGYAFNENPNIKDRGDFLTALSNAWNSPEWTNGVLAGLNDDEVNFLFNSSECKDKIKNNLSEKDYEKIFEEEDRGEYLVERAKPKGQKIQPKQIKVFRIEKKITKKHHIRAGVSIPAYNSSYNKWTKQEAKFIQIRKVKKMPIKQIIYAYNSHYKGNERTLSSVRTKIYRL